jgi:hypothetical protein
MPFIAHPFDVFYWYKYCIGVLEQGIDVNTILTSIRPLWFLMLIPVAYSYGFFSSILGLKAISVADLPLQMNPQYSIKFIPGPIFNFLVKTPMLIADVATTLILYKLVEQFFGRGKAKWTALLFYMNPFSIWISAAWGQYESIPAFFTILSLYLLLNEKAISSAFSLLLATLFKFYPSIFLIPATIYLFKRSNRRSLLKYYLIFFIPMLLFLIIGGPWLINEFFVYGYVFSTTNYLNLFGFGLTYWSISMLFPLDPVVWGPFSSLLTVALLLISTYFVTRLSFKEPLKDFVRSTFILFAAGLLSFRYVAEMRFLWVLPFLTIMFTLGFVSKKLYSLLSITSFIYAQKNFPYYLLPIVTINQDALKPLFEFVSPLSKIKDSFLLPTLLSAAVLVVLGIGFSILILRVYLNTIRK